MAVGQGEGPVGCAARMCWAWILLGAGRMLVGLLEGVFRGLRLRGRRPRGGFSPDKKRQSWNDIS